MQATFFSWKNNLLVLHVLIQPRACKDEIVGLHGDRLKIRLKAAPTDGEANKYLIQYLAKALNLPQKRISLMKGHTGRQKTLSIETLVEIPPKLLNLS